MQKLRLGDPLDKNTDVGAVNSGEQLERIETLVAAGEEEARPPHRRLRHPRARALVRPDAVHRGLARAPDRGRGDLRPGRLDAHLPHPGGGDREGQQLQVRPGGGDLDRQGRQGVRGRLAACRPAWCGRTPTTTSTRRRPSAATRRAASAARAAPPACVPTCACHEPRLAVRKTYKLYVGGAFARSESGRHDPVLDHEGSHVAITRASRKDVATPSGRPQGAAGLGRQDRLQPRAGALPRRGGARSRSAEFAQQAVDLRGAKPPPRATRSPRPSTCSCTTRAGPTSCTPCSAA